ncbi:prepilin peptidase [Cryobacterium gelidum]|uniref:Prepilin leader peptidase/N-methyltransferase n=1 Tax=Cryobacterium gelidum TaxID=1259164 RepID=A0A4R9AP81_9MICO|nr:A24 family peptidase [Cryobacterium gelidum]TFD66587.1 prepilin peptidase [Cryobacterium gelidum]
MASFAVILAATIGLLIGSFLNVVIYRVPARRSIVSPPSACASCGARIRPWDNVPVISWLALRAKCRDCGERISIRYPLVELGTAVFFGAVAWWVVTSSGFGSTGMLGVVSISSTGAIIGIAVTLVVFLYLAAVSVALAMIDLDTYTLPNKIVVPAYPVSAALLVTAALLLGEPGRLVPAVIGGAALFALYLTLALLYPGGMGLGDVKLAGVLGLFLGFLGWGPLVVGAFSAFLLGGVFSLVLVITRRANRKSSIPFGPWMLAGAWLGIFGGEQIAAGYLALYGLT